MSFSRYLFRSKTSPQEDLLDLRRLQVASPCPVNWADMAGDNRVRQCAECNLNVYNLSAMTTAEISYLVRDREGRLCVRFFRRADGTMITQDCPRGVRAAATSAARRAAKVAAAVLSAIVSMYPALASGKSRPQVCALPPRSEQNQPGIEFHVFDPQGALIPGAQVALRGKDGKIAFSGITSEVGELHIIGVAPGRYTLSVSASGFRTYESPVTLQSDRLLSVKLQLRIAPATTEIQVTASPAVVQGIVVGVLSSTSEGIPQAGGAAQHAPLRP